MSIRDYLSIAVTVTAVILLFTAEPAINNFGKDSYARSWCTFGMVKSDVYLSAPPEEQSRMRIICHRSSLIGPFRFMYDLTGFPSAE